MNETATSITAQTLWLTSYNSYDHLEIRQLRERMNNAMKMAITQGM